MNNPLLKIFTQDELFMMAMFIISGMFGAVTIYSIFATFFKGWYWIIIAIISFVLSGSLTGQGMKLYVSSKLGGGLGEILSNFTDDNSDN